MARTYKRDSRGRFAGGGGGGVSALRLKGGSLRRSINRTSIRKAALRTSRGVAVGISYHAGATVARRVGLGPAAAMGIGLASANKTRERFDSIAASTSGSTRGNKARVKNRVAGEY